jgi:hypothetical protein
MTLAIHMGDIAQSSPATGALQPSTDRGRAIRAHRHELPS